MIKIYNPFREALPHIHQGSRNSFTSGQDMELYICYALSRGHDRFLREHSKKQLGNQQILEISNNASHHISKLLENSAFLESWLLNRVPEYQKFAILNPTEKVQEQTQVYRYRWCEHLAEQYDRGEIKL